MKKGKRNSKAKLKLVPKIIKINEWDLDQIQRKADIHAEGNFSAWMRYAARIYTPKKGERVNLKAG